jgi:MoaA/NifB/PqqE/SkfB family radical SAM enzyme
VEPKKQIEIQLGHMCNNRCVFCVSGQETARGRARPLEVAPLVTEIERAFAAGHRKITLLGGEPTLQPGFLDVVRRAVALGFEEIVIFTNGAKTARADFIDEIRALGARPGQFTWRISLQGATREAHERTTLKEGSFGRIERTLAALAARGERVTVNMCVVQSNYASVAAFPALILPFGATQLHLDMVRPLDAGERSEDELRAMIPRYSDMVPALTEMVRGFPDGFDVNIGNLPYCVAPRLARWIHHDGERTDTIAVDGDRDLSAPWDKYEVKRRDKIKVESCTACMFEPRCSGVFETYARFHGTEELVPITLDTLGEIDPERRFLALHLRPLVASLARLRPPAPYTSVAAAETGDQEITITLGGEGQRLVLALRSPRAGEACAASFERFRVHLVSAAGDRAAAIAALAALAIALENEGGRVIHPLGADALGGLAASVAARLARLRARAPFGALVWRSVSITEAGRRAEATFTGPAGERATVWLADTNGRASGGYRVDAGEPTPDLVEGLRAVMDALKPRLQTAAFSA